MRKYVENLPCNTCPHGGVDRRRGRRLWRNLGTVQPERRPEACPSRRPHGETTMFTTLSAFFCFAAVNLCPPLYPSSQRIPSQVLTQRFLLPPPPPRDMPNTVFNIPNVMAHSPSSYYSRPLYIHTYIPTYRALSLRKLVSGYECGRVFPAGVGPGSPSRDAASWLPSRFSLSVETRRRYG